MNRQNISISIGGTNLAETPSTTISVTQWVGDFDDFVRLCQKAWLMLTDEARPIIAFEDQDEAEEAMELLSREGFADSDSIDDDW